MKITNRGINPHNLSIDYKNIYEFEKEDDESHLKSIPTDSVIGEIFTGDIKWEEEDSFLDEQYNLAYMNLLKLFFQTLNNFLFVSESPKVKHYISALLYYYSEPDLYFLINNVKEDGYIYIFTEGRPLDDDEIIDYPSKGRFASYEDKYHGHSKSLKNLIDYGMYQLDGLGHKRRVYFKYTPEQLIKKIVDCFEECKHDVPEDTLFYKTEYFQTMLSDHEFFKAYLKDPSLTKEPQDRSIDLYVS